MKQNFNLNKNNNMTNTNHFAKLPRYMGVAVDAVAIDILLCLFTIDKIEALIDFELTSGTGWRKRRTLTLTCNVETHCGPI